MRNFIIATTALSGVLLLLLSLASENTTLFARNYPLLLGLNLAKAATARKEKRDAKGDAQPSR